ncbi:SAM-dependent methyltransferase [Candidatus Arcticimaribacter forsetii]|uniref:SAM-dependent methyltransferase n=1 Tax=Candidatus Arcticimaribacter forsetii TaxID=2820661 RepID=UPI0020774C69|nr:SAM-dependent methyltransferase [Candidatus Arcticimaribacter forsetii]MDB4674207.1 SAM-dependent methyltransferase [Flavobacteriaceae bacterium]
MELKNQDKEKGVLYLIPSPLGQNAPMEVLPLTVRKVIEELTHFIVENEKDARAFIKRISPKKNQSTLKLFPLNKFTLPEEILTYLDPIEEGITIGVISDAGCPGVADPGAEIVKMAHRKKITIHPLVGPSSILLAIMGSGLNGQNFAFNGYLPIDKAKRQKEIKKLEKKSFDFNQSQLFIETPYRNDQMLQDLLKSLDRNTEVCVACDLTLPTQFIKTLSVKEWKKLNLTFHKRPAIFIIHKDPLSI